MRHKQIKISYWTYPEGDDFEDISGFTKEISHEYFLTVNKKRTDACGGGLYDIVVKITEDISLLELAKSYTEDGIKILIGYSLKPVFKSLKELFKKNEALKPSIEEIVLDFSDCKIRIYNYLGQEIEDIFDDLMEQLFLLRLSDKKFFKKVKTIHLPIVNHLDWYKLCDYRVILNVDEPIVKFTKEIYFGFWGVSTRQGKYVYDVDKKRLFKQVFYTQKTYDKLFDKAFENGAL